jgi:hypothetical protein
MKKRLDDNKIIFEICLHCFIFMPEKKLPLENYFIYVTVKLILLYK